MAEPCTILIGADDLMPALRGRTNATGDVVTFSDTNVLSALDAIIKRKPGVVALERLFAATSRGAALIGRIKADPALAACEIRVVSHDSDYVRISRRAATPAHPGAEPSAAVAVAAPAVPLDYRGTRRAPRFRISGRVEVILDGNPATLVDLSLIGAQVLSRTILRPNQRVRMALPDQLGVVRFNAAIAWASFEMPRTDPEPRYRAGVEFSDAEAAAVEAFCSRHTH